MRMKENRQQMYSNTWPISKLIAEIAKKNKRFEVIVLETFGCSNLRIILFYEIIVVLFRKNKTYSIQFSLFLTGTAKLLKNMQW